MADDAMERPTEATRALADAALAALELLLRGIEAAAGPDGAAALRELHDLPGDRIHAGLLAVVLRLVFLLHAEDRGLLPVDRPEYAARFGVLALFDRLAADVAADPGAMVGRFAAWPRLLATWRALHRGLEHPSMHLPARGGDLFDPDAHPFLEGRHHRRADERVALRGVDDSTVHRVLHRLLHREHERLAYRDLDVEHLGRVYEALLGHRVVRSPARADEEVPGLVLRPGPERRRTGSHYTPRGLTEAVVRTALAPLLAAMGPEPPARRLLTLAICDPAMGSGAFLIEVVRQLGDQLVAAWAREGDLARVADAHGDVVAHARRLVARRCVHGVDSNRLAVALARLSLWLVARAIDLPFTFVDHALRHGDTLVGLDLARLRAFHWTPGPPVPLVALEVQRALATAEPLVDDAGARARLLADLVVGAFFARDRPRDREHERRRRLDLVLPWLAAGGPPPAELLRLQAELRERLPPFHWPLEFPAVFRLDREEFAAVGALDRAARTAGTGELDHPAGPPVGALDRPAAMTAVVGNPPFMGGGQLSGVHGGAYLAWLLAMHPGAHGNADLSAHFLRRADAILGAHATIGLIATNTIGQGDTRATGLQHLVARRGYVLHDVTRSLPWPGAGAAVTISIVHLARGTPAAALPAAFLRDPDPDRPGALVARVTPTIDSHLRPGPERPDPRVLPRNRGLSFLGSKIYGQGFILTPAERDVLIARDPRNAARIFPYLGGEDINADPRRVVDRHVINFGAMELSEAERWPDLLDIVRARVKPGREHNNRAARRRHWWRFGEVAPALHAAIRGRPRCLVNSQVSKHLIFDFAPTDRVFAHTLYVHAVDTWTFFAVLQSRVHEAWARLHSSSMKTDLRYSVADGFETFPFPTADPRAVLPALEAVGEQLHRARAAHREAAGRGLTATYNALKDPECADPSVVALRALHVALDRAVLHAYGWDDLAVPAYAAARTPAARRACETFAERVLDRLFALNGERAAAASGPAAASPRDPVAS